MLETLKNSVGIWAFGPAVTRFIPPGAHSEVAGETITAKTERVAEGLSDILDGLEYHYPGEVNEDNLAEIGSILAGYGMEMPMVAAGLHNDPTYRLGALVNPDEKLRKEGLAALKRGVDVAAEAGADFIIWPGVEGYNYPFQRRYEEVWRLFTEGIAECVEHAASRGVKVHLEHKNSEPAMKILMRNIGMMLHTIRKVEDHGVSTQNLKVNMDWQHLLMNGENLAEYAALLAAEGRLGHQHGNDGWGTFDDDNVVGTNFFMQTLELAQTLQDVGYGRGGEILGLDLYPYTEDQVIAVRRSILHWEFIWELASRIDRAALDEAKGCADALSGYRSVYEVLGLDTDFEKEVIHRRAETRDNRRNRVAR